MQEIRSLSPARKGGLFHLFTVISSRGPASTGLDDTREILTNRNRLSENILRDVNEAAAGYGVKIIRADVKDLAFPGKLREVMNRSRRPNA